jgi:2-dehydro-3-deoxyphosphogluconate aldolase/(4S)-4-hydroxy-2-oxoglutarate aldolase
VSVLNKMNEQFAIPVIREMDAGALESICLALADGGLRIIEITLMSDAALTVISQLAKKSELLIGAGTVLNSEQAKQAINAGARFLVSPGLNEDAVKFSHSQNISFFPGVLTPTEVMKAKELGCEMVKIFPASAFGGTAYIKSLQGPFPGMKWMATGGIGLKDLKEYLNSPVTCVGLGSQMTPADKVKSQDWPALKKLAEAHVTEIKSGRNK